MERSIADFQILANDLDLGWGWGEND